MGGMQSILGGVAGALQSAGCRVVFLTSEGEEDDFYALPAGCTRVVVGHWRNKALRAARRKNIVSALREHHVSVLFHHLFDTPTLGDDIMAARECGVKVVVHFHSAATSLFARSARFVCDVESQFAAYRSADALICLSRCDELFFRALGVRARYIPNPMPALPDTFRRKGGVGRSLVWIGRFSEQEKRPQDALAVFAEVLRTMPDATLTMLGSGPADGKLRQLVAEDAALSRAVRMPGKVLDVWSELANADVLLLTSVYEGFPAVVAEAYAAGVPVVGYALEYLELCEAGEAYHAVQGGDVSAAAREVEALLSDGDAWTRAHCAAQDAFARFASFDLAAAYDGLLSDVLAARDVADPPMVEQPYGTILRAFFAHACAGRRMLLDAQSGLSGRPNSIRGCLRFGLRRIFARLFGGKGSCGSHG